MKNRSIYIFSFLFLLFSNTTLFSLEMISVEIKYNSFVDSACALFKGYDIKDSWKEELKEKKPLLESEWKKYGGKLLKTTEKVTGKKFQRTDATVYLTLCNTPSRSTPLIVNMRYALKSFTNDAVPIHVKTGTLFHELLHQFIDDNIPQDSPLLEQYKNEHQRVLEHLHLLALLKAVYINLGLLQELSDIIRVDSMLPNGYYKKAWEIVNSTPQNYMSFVYELQQ